MTGDHRGDLMGDIADEDPADEDTAGAAGAARRDGRSLRRAVLALVAMLSALVLLAVGAAYVITDRLTSNVARIPDVFGPLDPAGRPQEAGPDALTFLVVGSDSRDPEGPDQDTATPRAARSDVIMLLRLNGERTRATVVSLPRDSWVEVPGHGLAKINAAYAFGGPTLLVRTVEQLTSLRVDHFATLDFAGFQGVIDGLGGITVAVAQRTTFGDIVFEAGTNVLDGRTALAYARQRKGLPRGDLDRVRRHQAILRSVLLKAGSSNLGADPARLHSVLDTLTRTVQVDDTLDDQALQTLLIGSSTLPPSAVTFLTAPVAGLGTEGQQSVVRLDPAGCAELWRALRDDDVATYTLSHRDDLLDVVPS